MHLQIRKAGKVKIWLHGTQQGRPKAKSKLTIKRNTCTVDLAGAMSAGFSSVTSPSCTLTRHPPLTFSTTGRYRHTTVRLLHRANRAARKQHVQIRAGLLSMFMPTKQINKVADLASELLETASRTDGGASTSQDQRTTIRDLVRFAAGRHPSVARLLDRPHAWTDHCVSVSG